MKRYTSNEAAFFLGYAEFTLRKSRMDGLLAGVKAPPYQKQGHSVFYSENDLIKWLRQFPKQTFTHQFSDDVEKNTNLASAAETDGN
ncbi:hypothetical protein ACMXYW_04680 [Neptuniibacter sp. QD48_55]|uniref:hypothetical protein n=1 Tax=Neptuniibacter sp. QD48_55 TaxID=3398212 RepID=UPI0039F59B5C